MPLINYEKKDLIRFTGGTYFLVIPVWEDPEWVKNNPDIAKLDADSECCSHKGGLQLANEKKSGSSA